MIDGDKAWDVVRRIGGEKKVEDVREEVFVGGIQSDHDDDRVDVYIRRCGQGEAELVFCTGNCSYSIINCDLKKLQDMSKWLFGWAKEVRHLIKEENSTS